MYKILSSLIGLTLYCAIYAQSPKSPPVVWKIYAAKVSDSLYEVDLRAFISPPWHIFPNKVAIEEPSIPTTIIFEGNPYLKAVGPIEEKGSLLYQPRTPEIRWPFHYYEKEVIFSQYFSFRQNVKQATLKGIVQWQRSFDNYSNVSVAGVEHFSIIIIRE